MEYRSTRSYRRFKVSLPLWVRFRRAKPSAQHDDEEITTTTNMSLGGCFFYISRKPALGSSAVMIVDTSGRLPRGKGGKFLCQGKVVRVSEQEQARKVGVACTIDSYSFMPVQA